MKGRAIWIVCLLVLLSSAGTVSAETFSVGDTYDSDDTLLNTDAWNEYEINADSSKKVEYSFQVQGDGSIMVLFVKGHDVDMDSSYYIMYSEDTSTKSYSNTFPVDSGDGTRFTILIVTEETENVTYSAGIKVIDKPVTDLIFGIIIFVVIIIVIAAIGAAWRSRRKRKAERMAQESQVPPETENE
jgi:hypothetical protein